MVVVGWVVVESGNSYSNRTHDRGDDNIDSGDVIVVMVKTIVVVAIYGGYAPLDFVRRSYMLHKLADPCSRCGPALRSVETVTGMPLWCKDFAEHGNANSRLTKSARFGEPTLYPAFTLSDYRICDSRHPLSVLRSLSVALGISTVNQVIRPRILQKIRRQIQDLRNPPDSARTNQRSVQSPQ
ncbi:hypothetical protein PoB_004941500 [Plakobranchus ocellatus]|uniref:Uncharacterized protein n=1 Tax=Plakobranchus ocellatus TaxID=259542 RepID=A0AAV4BUC9_9GAST|nr:hypothetical protein PoB_004941500 [Plakobranchus ocellatus]